MGRIHAESMLLQQGSMMLDSCSLSFCGRKEQRLNRWASRLHLASMCTLLAGILGAFQVEVCWKHRWLMLLWSGTAKGRNTVNSFLGLTGRSVTVLGKGPSGIHLASFPVQLSVFSNWCQLYCFLQHCSKVECGEFVTWRISGVWEM